MGIGHQRDVLFLFLIIYMDQDYGDGSTGFLFVEWTFQMSLKGNDKDRDDSISTISVLRIIAAKLTIDIPFYQPFCLLFISFGKSSNIALYGTCS